MARLLYQQIMDVPGLTGSWKERLGQYYKQLTGGEYRGTKEQGFEMLAGIAKKNWAQPKPVAQPAPVAAPETVIQDYTDPYAEQMARSNTIPQFENAIGDYEKLWQERFAPGIQLAGESQINPEALRNYNQAYEGYMGNMVSSGGQRFGRGFSADNAGGGLAGIGNLKAASERARLGTLQDWMGQQKGGIQDLWYNNQRDIWNKAKTQIQPGETMDIPKIPTWQEGLDQYGTAYGVGESKSPFYG